MFFTISKKGFSLFELLVAIAVGSIIVIGLFDIFKNVVNTRDFALKESSYTEIISKTVSLMDKDIRCKIGKFELQNTLGVTKLSFETTDSLRFAGSIPVFVSYYMETKQGKSYLVREEQNEAAGYDMKTELSDIFKKIEFKFYSNGEWGDMPSDIVRIYLYTKNKKEYVFCARGMIR